MDGGLGWGGAVAGEQPIPPHLEVFPGLTALTRRVWPFLKFPALAMVISRGRDSAMNQVKPSEQVVGPVATVSLSRLVARRLRSMLV